MGVFLSSTNSFILTKQISSKNSKNQTYLFKRMRMLRMLPSVPAMTVMKVRTPEMKNWLRKRRSESESSGYQHLDMMAAVKC